MKGMNSKQPTALSIAKIAFPEWKGRKAKFSDRSIVSLHGMSWSGGSMNEYCAVNLTTGAVATMPESMRSPAEYGGSDGYYKVAVPVGIAIVEHSYFQGKDCGCTVHLSPAAELASGETRALASGV